MERVYAQVQIDQAFGPAQHFDTIGSLVSVVAQNAFVVAGVVAFGILVFGGFAIITGAGSGDSKKLEQGRKAMTGAALGLVLIVGSFWIIQILETLTGMTLLPTR